MLPSCWGSWTSDSGNGRAAPLEDAQLREMSAFALGRLAQNVDNQAGIVQQGGLRPLLENLNSRCHNIQRLMHTLCRRCH